jgi:hypothetical protein
MQAGVWQVNRANWTSVVRAVWVALCLALLVMAELMFDGSPNSDAGLVMCYALSALGLPLALAGYLALGGVAMALESASGIFLSESRLLILVEWTVFSGLGYIQWFRLLPWAVRRWRARRGAAAAKPG